MHTSDETCTTERRYRRFVVQVFLGSDVLRKKILSVGIDIGTTTTIVVFSNIYVENIASTYRIPDAKIVEKQVIYRSPVYFTPLESNTVLDVDNLTEIIRTEYEKAEIHPDELRREP
jgi:ethanolamine utilization protein EutA